MVQVALLVNEEQDDGESRGTIVSYCGPGNMIGFYFFSSIRSL